MEYLKSYGWIFILIAMAGDLLVSFFLSMFYRNYSNLKMSISALGNPSSPVRNPFNIWMLSIICFAAAMVFFVLFVMSDKQEFKNTIIDNEGLWQRLNLAFMYLPLAITAIIRIGK